MDSMSEPTSPATGQLIRLDVFFRTGGLWLGPVWAVLCGIIASGRFTWNARGLLLAGLTFFLVDGLWATLWSAIGETNWAAIAARWNASPPPLRMRALPYTQPGAPGDRATHWLSQLLHWWTTELQPTTNTTIPSIVICLVLGAALSAILGWQMLTLSAAALATIQIGLVINRASGQPVPAVKAALEVGLAWLAGHVAFGQVSFLSVLAAALFTITYTGGLQLAEHNSGLPNWRWSQLIVGLVLLIAQQPVAALAMFSILFAQLLLEPALRNGRSTAWFLRSSQAWLIAAMLITAFTIK